MTHLYSAFEPIWTDYLAQAVNQQSVRQNRLPVKNTLQE